MGVRCAKMAKGMVLGTRADMVSEWQVVWVPLSVLEFAAWKLIAVGMDRSGNDKFALSIVIPYL